MVLTWSASPSLDAAITHSQNVIVTPMSTASVQHALARPLEDRGEALIELIEDQWFDRKSSRIQPKALGDALIGMANAEGGTLVIGLTDETVEGVIALTARINQWRQVPIDFSQPPVTARYRLEDCLNSAGAPDQVLVVGVEASETVHSNTRDEVFLRVGDQNRRMSFAQRQELLYDKGQATFETRIVPNLSLDDLDAEIVADYAMAVGSSDPDTLLKARGLVDDADRVLAAGCLLFGSNPEGHFPEAYVRLIRYRGTERGTGSRQQILEDIRCEGPIPIVLRNAHRQMRTLVPTLRALGPEGLFEDMPSVPEDAWLEGLVNAVVHRSYNLAGDHIRVEIFDDRIEIESPGRSPGLVDLSDPLNTTRFARNPRIARVSADLNFGQELGEGIRRMFEEMRLAGLPDPVYRQTSGSVQLTLYAVPSKAVPGDLAGNLHAILSLIRQADGMSSGDLTDAIGVSRPTALRRLKALEEMGLIERVGTGPKDPTSYWKLSS